MKDKYVGTRKTKNLWNWGEVWTPDENGIYRCPDRPFTMTQKLLNVDVAAGHLIEVSDIDCSCYSQHQFDVCGGECSKPCEGYQLLTKVNQ